MNKESRFHDHFRTGEIWEDLMIKWLLRHFIHQHINYSKGVLVHSRVGPRIIKVIREIGMKLVPI